VYEAANVHLEDYTDEDPEQRLVCTGTELRHVNRNPENPTETTVPLDEITSVRRDTDRSHTGFKSLGYVFGAFATLFTCLSVPFLLAGVVFTPIAGGSFLTTALCWYGCLWFHRLDQGALDVLEIGVGEGRYCFFAPKESDSFDDLLPHLPPSE
jgi:hypothetical protein